MDITNTNIDSKEVKQKATNRVESFIDEKINQLKEQDLPLYEAVEIKAIHKGDMEKASEAKKEQDVIKKEITKLEEIYSNIS